MSRSNGGLGVKHCMVRKPQGKSRQGELSLAVVSNCWCSGRGPGRAEGTVTAVVANPYPVVYKGLLHLISTIPPLVCFRPHFISRENEA